MAFPRPSSRIALLILLLAVIVLSLFGSLVLADRKNPVRTYLLAHPAADAAFAVELEAGDVF